jgi:hypothetical protein
VLQNNRSKHGRSQRDNWAGGTYSYIRVLPDGFLLEVIVFTVCEHEYMNIHTPPPPPQLSRLATALAARFDVNSENVLQDLLWSTPDVRRHTLKSVLMYKILNEQSAPSLREIFIKIKDLIIEYNFRSNDKN